MKKDLAATPGLFNIQKPGNRPKELKTQKARPKSTTTNPNLLEYIRSKQCILLFPVYY
jgi:hypothetical protein